MRYLVDANVLSEPTKPNPDANAVAWLRDHESDLVVDPIVLGELSIGIEALPASQKRQRLEQWFEALVATIQCLPWDTAVGRRWARLVVELKRRGEPVPLLDGMIAATALAHHLTVATRKTSDFRKTGVTVVDPFASQARGRRARDSPRGERARRRDSLSG